MNFFKRSISVVLVGSLLGVSIPSNLFAETIFDDAVTSINKARSWHDEHSSTNNYYTGSVYVRFKTSNPPPIIKVSAPEVQASCSGINIKGMFVSILNLDQLGNMLQNAGASLAWGVAVGLIYSLPGIANAFKMINDWAKKIQQILGEACQSGIILGEHLLSSTGYNKNSLQTKIDSKIDNAASVMQERMSGIAKALGLNNIKFDQNGIIDLAGDEQLSQKDKIDAWEGLIINGLLSNISLEASLVDELNQVSGGQLYKNLGIDLDNMSSQEVTSINVFINGQNIPAASNNKNISLEKLITDDAGIGDTQKQNKWKTLFTFYFYVNQGIGDIYVNNDVTQIIKNAFAYLQNDSNKNEAKALDLLTSPQKYALNINMDGKAAESEAARELAFLLVFGANALYNPSETNYIPTTKMHVLNIVAFNSENLNMKEAFAVLSADTYTSKLDLSGWDGAYVSAKCATANLLNETNASVTYNGKTYNCSDVNYYVFPSLRKYQMIYMNSPAIDRPKLKAVLSKYIEEHYAMDLANYLTTALQDDFFVKMRQFKNVSSKTNSIKESSNRAPAQNPAKLVQIINNYTAKVSNFIDEFKKTVAQLSSYDDKEITKRELDKIFNEQHIKNKERGLRNVITQ